jgi:hypothetical protein
MTEGSGETGDAQTLDNKERIKQAVAKLIEGTRLQVEEFANELVITNPDDPENGRLHVDFEHGYMSWERVVWEHFGTVAHELGEEGTKVVARETVAGLLGG